MVSRILTFNQANILYDTYKKQQIPNTLECMTKLDVENYIYADMSLLTSYSNNQLVPTDKVVGVPNVTYSYYNTLINDDPCTGVYRDIYLGSDGKYYVDIDGIYTLMYGVSIFWNLFTYSEIYPFGMMAYYYDTYMIDSTSTILTFNGVLQSYCGNPFINLTPTPTPTKNPTSSLTPTPTTNPLYCFSLTLLSGYTEDVSCGGGTVTNSYQDWVISYNFGVVNQNVNISYTYDEFGGCSSFIGTLTGTTTIYAGDSGSTITLQTQSWEDCDPGNPVHLCTELSRMMGNIVDSSVSCGELIPTSTPTSTTTLTATPTNTPTKTPTPTPTKNPTSSPTPTPTKTPTPTPTPTNNLSGVINVTLVNGTRCLGEVELRINGIKVNSRNTPGSFSNTINSGDVFHTISTSGGLIQTCTNYYAYTVINSSLRGLLWSSTSVYSINITRLPNEDFDIYVEILPMYS